MSLSSVPRSFQILRFACSAWFALVCCCTASFAQQPKVLAPHQSVAPRLPRHREWDKPAAPQVATGGLWMIDGNFKSQLVVTNLMETDELSVTPILYLGNGVGYRLDPVRLEPSGTGIVDLNQALAAKGVAPYATLSGYVEVQYSWPWAAICATVKNIDTLHSLIFMSGMQSAPSQEAETQAPTMQNLEGMWWKQEPSVYGFVALSNVTDKPIHASLRVTSATNNNLAKHEVTVSPHGTKMIELMELLSTADSSGGVLLNHDGPEQGLIVNAGLEDPATGYSAHLPLSPVPDASEKPSATSVVALGLMSGAADPMMNFPNGTAFTAYSVVRNISSQPFVLTPTLWWMEGGTARSAELPGFTVGAHRTQNMNLPALLTAAGFKNFNGSFNLQMDTQGQKGGLLISSGSVDQKNTYVFEVGARGVLESISKSMSYWSTGNGDDTMVTVWNPADEAQDFLFTLYFTGGGHYGWPIHLEPRATYTFNISEIVHAATPDAEGNLIPSGVHEGSARLSGSLDHTQHVLVAMDSGVYNIQKATCGVYCETCDGFTGTSVVDNPFAVAVARTKQQTFVVQYDTGNQYNRTGSSTWTSSKTSVATVSSGLVSGVATGSVTVTAQDNTFEPVYTPNVCGTNLPTCPLAQPQQPGGSGPGNVNPIIANISPTWGKVGTSVQVTISGTGFGSSPTVSFTTSGITVTYGSVNDSTISATFTIAPNATVGFTGVTVTNHSTGDGSTPTSDPVNFQVTPTTAVPVNFQQVGVSQQPNGVLQFVYEWDSSTGNIGDLANCNMGEIVTYPGTASPYIWTSPPYTQPNNPPTTNPFTTSFPATNFLPAPYSHVGGVDTHSHPTFRTPYAGDSFTSTQYYRFQCTTYNNNAWTNISGPISILRTVSPNGNGTWSYVITKSGSSNSVNPMP